MLMVKVVVDFLRLLQSMKINLPVVPRRCLSH